MGKNMSNVYAINRTESSITVSSWDIYYINSSNAELITVYDSIANPCDCFKYLFNNVSWFYVLDGIQNSWTDDLSSIGYSATPPIVLPTVSTNGDFGLYNQFKFTTNGVDYTFNNNSITSVYINTSGTNYGDWDSGCTYAVVWYRDYASSYTGHIGIEPVESPSWASVQNKMFMHNLSGGDLTVAVIKVAVCNTSNVTVITVYNSSNIAYNSFKYTTDGTEYYYVLDNMQTDWTDDLSSIGYSLTLTTQRAYLTTPPHNDKYMDTGRDYTVCDNSGNHITYDSSKIYNVVGGFRVDGTSVSSSFTLLGSFGILNLKNNGSRIEVGYVEYYTI